MRRLAVFVSFFVLAACGDAPREAPDAGAARLVRAGEIPCEPRAVLEAICQNCHADPPRNGAPFSQMTYQDIDADLDGEPVWARMRRAVEEGRMPLDPYALTGEQQRILLAWLGEGAPPAPVGTVCTP